MKVRHLVEAIESIAPTSYAESWDKVGLHVGRLDANVRGAILLTIDLTETVMDEALNKGAGAIISYHPPIWTPLARLTDQTPKQRTLLRAIEAGIAIYSPHTALDAVPGGMADWLCEALSGGSEGKIKGDCRAIMPHSELAPTQQVKIVTFVPKESVEKVRNALASAGAGIIGEYTLCSFSAEGSATFLGNDKSNPKVGKSGRLEEVPEARLEMVCSKAALALALETLKGFHPYESVPVDVYELLSKPARGIGLGRRLRLDHPATIAELAKRLKKLIARPNVRVACKDLTKPVSIIGVCPGAGESLVSAAADDGCELFVTGEMKHHDIIHALDQGVEVILGEHTSTERGYLPRLARSLESRLPKTKFIIAQSDIDPVAVL